MASLRATLAVEKPPGFQVQELLASYTFLDTRNKERTRLLDAELESLKREMVAVPWPKIP